MNVPLALAQSVPSASNSEASQKARVVVLCSTLATARRRLYSMPEQDTFAAGNSYLGLLHQASHSHADRAALANVLRDRGHAVKSDFCKIYRRKP